MNRVFYHDKDLDGHCSGAIVRYWMEKNSENFVMYPHDYGEEFPLSDINERDTVYFVDITLQPYDRMKDIEQKKNARVIVCDHHKTFLNHEDSKQFNGNSGYDLAGCELTWNYFFPDQQMPLFVYLLGRYDIWDISDPHMWTENILPFQYGIRSYDTDPRDSYNFWKQLFELNQEKQKAFVYSTIYEGKTILNYISADDKKSVDKYAFSTTFHGLKAIAMNSTRANSLLFKSVWNHKDYDVMVLFTNNKGQYWTVSLYSDKENVDVGDIARQWGGGGHYQAAGFQARDIQTHNGELKIIQ